MPQKRVLPAAHALTVADSQSAALGVADRTDRSQGELGHRSHLWRLLGFVSSIAGGATTITCKLVRDTAGDEAIIEEVTHTIEVGRTTATDGAISVPLDWGFAMAADASLYVVARTNAGTCSVIWELQFRQGG